jgi:energy-coupling factor transporter ATP-binding protein EcfA2
MFRSVRDSGWIETDTVTALIGTNESGKTNLLVPLWKLNPAKGGDIDLIADLPRADYNRMRNEQEDQVFVQAEFATDADLRATLTTATGLAPERFDVVRVARRFNGEHVVSFPNASPPRTMLKARVAEVLSEATKGFAGEKTKKEEALKSAAAVALTAAATVFGIRGDEIDAPAIAEGVWLFSSRRDQAPWKASG